MNQQNTKDTKLVMTGKIVKLNDYDKKNDKDQEYTVREVTVVRESDSKLIMFRVPAETYETAKGLGEGALISVEMDITPDLVTNRANLQTSIKKV